MGKDFPKKEKVTGMWYGRNPQGEEITFTREWGGHRFTDDEVKCLLAGESIEIEDLVSKSGSIYSVVGRLSEQTYKEYTFVGFERLGFGFPHTWCGHTFTDEEKAKLRSGGRIALQGVKNKAGKVFDCEVTYEDEGDGQGMRIVPHFDTSD